MGTNPSAVSLPPEIDEHFVVQGYVDGVAASTFLDDGGTADYIDTSFAHFHNLILTPLKEPLRLGLADLSTSQKQITHYATVTLLLAGHTEKIKLYVADCGYDVVLGRGWHRLHYPVKGWHTEQLTFQPHCLQHMLYDDSSLYTIPGARPMPFLERPSNTLHADRPRPQSPLSGTSDTEDQGPTIAEVGAKVFNMYASREGAEVQAYCLRPTKGCTAQDPHAFATIADSDYARFMAGSDKDEDPRHKLPQVYHDWADVWSRTAADKLAPHRPGIDHEVKLKDGKPPPFVRPRPMSVTENEVIKTWIDDQLRKGNIQRSNSPAASPLLIVKKPAGGLRVCVDYRALNELTIKSRYPIPLIQDTLNRISGKKWFTKLDVIAAFNRIRMARGDEWKTAFTTRYGQFECLAMPFGLCNAPGTFQSYINDSLREFLDDFVSAYLDDLLIFSDTYEEHVQHVRSVLDKLREAGLQLDIDKCEFSVHETKYLGMVIGADGIRMDPAKVAAIQDWQTPRTVREVLSFLGFANFYRRFIRGFSKIALPLTRLTRTSPDNGGGAPWNWTLECQDAFDRLKVAFTTDVVLAHFKPGLETVLETDASDFVTAAVLSQRDTEGFLRPVAYLSKKMSPQECNYDIYDKELLAIVKAFEEWRPELTSHYADEEGDFSNLPDREGKPVLVYSDHKNLEYFTTSKQLNRRQARWAEFLSQFFFRIVYRPGVQGTKPDSLTRRLQDKPQPGDPRLTQQNRVLLPASRFAALELSASFLDDESSLIKDIRQLYAEQDDLQQAIRQLNRGQETPLLRRQKLDNRSAATAGGLIYIKNRYGLYSVYVPQDVDGGSRLRTRIVREYHCSSACGHAGRAKTLDCVQRDFIWPGISQTVRQVVRSCHNCISNKAVTTAPAGLLQPLPVPFALWDDVAMDFVVQLPKSKSTVTGLEYEHVLTVTDRLGKGCHLIEVNSMEAEHIAYVFLDKVYRHHGLPLNIVSDRGTQWVSAFWRRLCALLGIDHRLSTAYHPQTDGQAENTNKEMERYLRAFVNYAQDDWVDWLPVCELSKNNHTHESTGVSPQFAEKGRNARTTLHVDIPPQLRLMPHPQRIAVEAAGQFAARLKSMQDFLRTQLQYSQQTQADYADAHRIVPPRYEVGDKVYVSTKNWKTSRPAKKLDIKWYGPVAITAVLGDRGLAYRLDLNPASIAVHNSFHPSLLRPAGDVDEGERPPPIEVRDAGGDRVEEHYEVDRILDSRKKGRGVQYLVRWKGYLDTEATWEPAAAVVDGGAHHAAADFHHDYPRKPLPASFLPPPGWVPYEAVGAAATARVDGLDGSSTFGSPLLPTSPYKHSPRQFGKPTEDGSPAEGGVVSRAQPSANYLLDNEAALRLGPSTGPSSGRPHSILDSSP